MSQLIAQIKEIFSQEGVLSKHIQGYSPRLVQLEMAIAIAKALEQNQVLITEAGTGTGKTYAYLIPSLISGKKVIISTGTKNLQDQLYHRDLPLIRKALGIPIKIAILKGRANYLCLHRLHTYMQTDFVSKENLHLLYSVKRWAEISNDGEIEHFESVKLSSELLPYITSTAENCLGQDCEFYSKCFLIKARRQAQEASLLIVNHHLFFADSQLKDSGVNELLPDSNAIIFDEAHQLHEIGTHFLGEAISNKQLQYLARDIQAEQQVDAPDLWDLKYDADRLIYASKELLRALGTSTRGTWENIVHKPQIKAAIQTIETLLMRLTKQLEVAYVRGRGLENCFKRILDLTQKFKRLTLSVADTQIHWYETQENYFAIHHTPMSIGGYFQKLIEESDKSWIFTSATLSIGGDFTHFESHLGLPDATRLYLESPFDYAKQALLYLPALNVGPNDENYISKVVDLVVPLLELTEGRAFFLFTSHRALKEAALHLAKRVSFPLLIQGTAPKSQLLNSFCNTQHAVLLGTSSFWEGVDVKGSSLSCVIIDKIPFVAPDDPILKSRLEHYKRQGKNPFQEYQLPQAVITLRQGVGRLIRDINDRGVLMLCDPRLVVKDYGKIFLDSLPSIPMTSSLDDINTFLKEGS